MFSPTTLEYICPRNRHLAQWLRPLNDACARFAIDTPLRQAHFLAQLAAESNELQTLEENLHYSPQRLVQVWPKRFHNIAAAMRYARNPERLANHVYASRNGNGGETSRDGWRYRGRGAIQITGRANYAAIGEMLGENFLNTPDMLLEPKWAALSAGAFWARNGLNAVADEDRLEKVTRVVNGGMHGLDARRRYLLKAKEVLDVSDGGGFVEENRVATVGAPAGEESPAPAASGWFD